MPIGDILTMLVSFCTFNIRYGYADDGVDCWDNRRDIVCDLWRKHRWDVVGIQEGLRHQLDHIRKEVPEYAETGVGRDDGVSAGEHCAILYRTDRFDLLSSGTFWFSTTPEVPGSRGWGSRHARICTWAHLRDIESGRAFYVYNLHVDHESQEAREQSSAMLIERVLGRGDADPVVVMGDFNANPDNPSVSSLTEVSSPFPVDTYAATHPVDQAAYTYHEFTGADVDGKIDYIFASPDWTVDAAEIIRDHNNGRYPSDHFPVTATLSL